MAQAEALTDAILEAHSELCVDAETKFDIMTELGKQLHRGWQYTKNTIAPGAAMWLALRVAQPWIMACMNEGRFVPSYEPKTPLPNAGEPIGNPKTF